MRDNLPYLQVLAKSKPKVRKIIVEHGPSDIVLCICECTLNLLKGVIPLTPNQKQRLARYKKYLRVLANKKVSRKKKKTPSSSKRRKYFNGLITTCVKCTEQFVYKMNLFKGMVLVPEDVLDRLERKQKQETTPLVSNLMNIDENIDNILRRTDMPDDAKQTLYYADLERYLNLKHQKNNDFPTVKVNNTTNPDSNKPQEKEGTSRKTLSDSVIVDSIPKTMRERAVFILNRLKAYPSAISWDDTGQVKLDGKDIQGSNISDLLSDAVRRNNFNPAGSKEFFRVLSKINMPKDLVRNDERWKQAQIESSSEDEEIIYTSPRHQSPSRYLLTPPKRQTSDKTIKSKDTPKTPWHKY